MCYYDLILVKQLAEQGSILYENYSVSRDLGNLGLDTEQVCNILQRLSKWDYHTSYEYEDGKKYDSYVHRWADTSTDPPEIRELYIKIRVRGQRLHVGIASFHLSR